MFKGHVNSTEKVVAYFADFTSYFDDFATERTQDWSLFALKEDTSLQGEKKKYCVSKNNTHMPV